VGVGRVQVERSVDSFREVLGLVHLASAFVIEPDVEPRVVAAWLPREQTLITAERE